MKKLSAPIISTVIALSVCACGGGAKPAETTTVVETTVAMKETTKAEIEDSKLSKEDLLNEAVILKDDIAKKMFENPAFSTTVVGNTYTFSGKVYSIGLNYADLEIYADNNGQLHGYGFEGLAFRVYLPTEELINLEVSKMYRFVGKSHRLKRPKA